MQISFSGVITPYTYNCPYAHRLRNILRLKIPERPKPAEEEDVEQSRRQRGIELHNKISDYLKGVEDSFEFSTPLVEKVKAYIDSDTVSHIERVFYYDDMFNPKEEVPSRDEDFISITPDLVLLYKDGTADIYDWKFANTEYGLSRHYDELSFFLSGLISTFPDVSRWTIYIHFPESDYTLPIRTYNATTAARIQHGMIDRVQKILNDKILKPQPSKARCQFCDRRSEDAGGSGQCDVSAR